jgi:HK97 family phage prohead protease
MDPIERRVAGEVRVELDANRKIRGYAIVFNALSQDLGGFREIIMPEAVDRTLSEALDVRALVDHDSAKVIGRTRSGTLALRKDKKGLRVEIDPADTTVGRDILELVTRGDISGMSFAFRTLTDEWRMEDGETIREVHDMTISEVSDRVVAGVSADLGGSGAAVARGLPAHSARIEARMAAEGSSDAPRAVRRGRPRQMERPVRVNVSMSAGEYDRLYALGRACGKTVPAMIRSAICVLKNTESAPPSAQ